MKIPEERDVTEGGGTFLRRCDGCETGGEEGSFFPLFSVT